MAVTVRSSNLPSIDTQLVDPVTGECTTAWFNFFLSLFNRTGATQGSQGNSTNFLFPSGSGLVGQVLTSQGGQPTTWTDPLTEQQLTTDGFLKQGDLQNISLPTININIGEQQGAYALNNKLLVFWGEFDVPLSTTTPSDGGQAIESAQSITVIVPGGGIKRLLDVSVSPYRDAELNTSFLPGNGMARVTNYGYDNSTGIYVGRTDGAKNQFDVFTTVSGIHRYRGFAELT